MTCDAHVIRQEVSRTNGTYEGLGWVYVQIRITISFVVSDFMPLKYGLMWAILLMEYT